MPRFTILGSGDPDHPGFNQIIMDLLKTVDAELKLQSYRTDEELFEAIQDVDGVTQGGGVSYPRHIVEALPERVRVIGSGGIGVDFVDVDAATERGIIVYNIIGVFEREVAHQAMMLLLAQARQLLPINRAMLTRDGSIKRGTIQHLYGQTLGLVSFGNIGDGPWRR